ncbi:MAG: IS3 family transposase [Propionibacteriaceae bacterium]
MDYTDSHRERFGVEPVCAVLAEAGIVIAPSTYYARSKAPLTDVELDEAYMANQLRSLWQNNWGVYGARKLWHAARRAGHDIGRDQVARLMRLAGIAGTVRGRHRTVTMQRDQTAPRHPDLVNVAGMLSLGSTSCGWPTSSATRRSRTLAVVGGHRGTPVAAGVLKLEDGRSPRRGGGWWSSPRQRRVVPVLPDGAGSASETGQAYARNQRLNAPQDETTDPKPGGHGSDRTAHPMIPLAVGELLGWVKALVGRPR